MASALCGAATSLNQIVLFRLLQGACGAALVPLSQAILLDIYPKSQHGQAMAVWGMGAMLGPIMGPALGGWLTQNYSWRWVFYINLPFGVLALVLLSLFFSPGRDAAPRKLDFFGFAALGLGVASLQLCLDRGAQLDWFKSTEIWIEVALALLGFWWATIQTATAANSFINREVISDPNFIICTMFGFVVNILLFATLALLPPMLENLMGYPVVTTGIVTAPRGFGTLLSMFIVGRLIGRVDARWIILTGLALTAGSLWRRTHINLEMGSGLVVGAGVVQGFGVGMMMVPLSTLVFATLDPRLRTEAAGLYMLFRSIGSSVGISILEATLTRSIQTNHANLIANVRPDSLNFRLFAPPGWSLASRQGMAFIDAQVTRQAAMVSYVGCFRIMLLLALVAMPIVLMMRPPKTGDAGSGVHAME